MHSQHGGEVREIYKATRIASKRSTIFGPVLEAIWGNTNMDHMGVSEKLGGLNMRAKIVRIF